MAASKRARLPPTHRQGESSRFRQAPKGSKDVLGVALVLAGRDEAILQHLQNARQERAAQLNLRGRERLATSASNPLGLDL